MVKPHMIRFVLYSEQSPEKQWSSISFQNIFIINELENTTPKMWSYYLVIPRIDGLRPTQPYKM